MAGKDTEIADVEEEIFTDLHGNPDPISDDALADLTKALKTDDSEADPLGLDSEIGDGDGTIPGDGEEGEGHGGADSTAGDGETPIGDPEEADPRDLEVLALKRQNISIQAQSLERDGFLIKQTKERAEATMAATEAKIIKAKEEGDSKAEMEAQKEYLAAREAIASADTAARGIGQNQARLLADAVALGLDAESGKWADAPAASEKTAKTSHPSKLAGAFLAKNPWASDAKHASDYAILRALDQKLGAEKKIDKNTPAYFEELGRRFNQVVPGLVKGLDGKPIATGTRQRGGPSAMPSTGGRKAAGGNTPPVDPKDVKLDASDVKLASQFGMDIKGNKKHAAAWLAEKRSQASQARH